MTTETTFTKADEYRREVSAELSLAMRELHLAQREFDELTDERKEAKSSVDLAQKRVNRLADELRDIELNQYQPKLPPSNGKPRLEDKKNEEAHGTRHAIEALVKHGLTKKQCEMLRESELETATVEDLELCMRDDPHWHRRVKGMGEAKVDKVSDALIAFRQEHPVPDDSSEADDQVAQTEEFPDRNAPGGEDCGTVNRFRIERDDWSVCVAVGSVPEDQTWQSSVLATIAGDTGGRDTPRTDSQPYPDQWSAARAAVEELIASWSESGAEDPRNAAAAELSSWRDQEWPVAIEESASAQDGEDVPPAEPIEATEGEVVPW